MERYIMSTEERQKFESIHQQHYRLMIGDRPKPVSLRMVLVRDQNGEILVAGVRAWKERNMMGR